jgi:hypothetical protein
LKFLVFSIAKRQQATESDKLLIPYFPFDFA